MADVSVKMGVSGVSQFIQSMQQAGASVKTIDAALKQNEKQLKATGDAETYLQQKQQLLNGKLKEQERACKQAEAALKSLEANGTSKTSKSYQDMQLKLLNAQSAMMDTEQQIQELGTASVSASKQTDQLSDSLGGLNRKVSLEQVTSAISSITGGLEKAGKKAVEVGKQIWENITDSARWADDAATQAMILNMDVEEYQKYKKVFDTVGELTVQEWQKAKLKVQKAINDPTQDQTDILALLGINTHEMMTGKYGVVQGAARDFEDVFWEIGETLRRKVESGEMTQDLADTYANAIFGRGFAELNPMFALGKEGFAAALEEQNVVTEESVNKLAALNDTLNKLQGDFDTLKAEVTAGLAPALEGAAKVLDELLGRLLEYLQSEKGQKALEDMGKAVEGLFTDLSKIDPEDVVEGFAKVFNDIVKGLQWLEQNSGTVIGALEAVVIGWGALKITGGALEIYKLVQGIMGLSGGASAAGSAGAAAGAAWGSGFANAVLAAAPWLIGLYTLLNPAETGNNDLADANGEMTEEAWSDFLIQRQRFSDSGEKGYWSQLIEEAAEIVQASANLWDDAEGIRALSRYAQSGNKEQLGADLAALGYTLQSEYEPPKAVTNGQVYVESTGEVIPYSTYKKFGTRVDAEADLVVEDGAEQIEEQVGEVMIPTTLIVHDIDTNGIDVDLDSLIDAPGHANGLWAVPFDGYRAILHKGERIVPAREVGSSRNFSSNLYVESMYMNNGQDADGLAAAMAAAQRRTMSGYGN